MGSHGQIAAGWYPDPQNPAQSRYYDGQQWTEHVQAPQYAPPVAPPMPSRFVTKERKDTSHLLHLILTIITAGVWGVLVWLPLTLWHKMGPKKKTVTRAR